MFRYLVSLAILLIWPAAWANPAAPTDDKPAAIRSRLSLPESIYAGRRLRLADLLGDRLDAVERGWFLLLGTGNEAYLDEPRQNPDFLYLTGVDVAGAAVALSVGSGERSEVLFLNEPTAHDRIYDSPILVPGRFDW
ncbi:MAG: aminopeptidase P N-terminal domain-containing protein, partial [Acidobacteriota bacterium]